MNKVVELNISIVYCVAVQFSFHAHDPVISFVDTGTESAFSDSPLSTLNYESGLHKSHPKLTHMFVQNTFPADQMLLVLRALSLMLIIVIGLSGVQFRE